LKSGSVRIAEREIPTAPLVSYSKSRQVALTLKQWIEQGDFFLSEPVARIPAQGSAKPMTQKKPQPRPALFYRRQPQVSEQHATAYISWNEQACISCGHCLAICPQQVYRHDAQWRVSAEFERCSECGQCEQVCPRGAIVFSNLKQINSVKKQDNLLSKLLILRRRVRKNDQ